MPGSAAGSTGLLESISSQLSAASGNTPRFVALLDGLDRMTQMQRFEELVRTDIRALANLGVGVVLVVPLRAQFGIDRAWCAGIGLRDSARALARHTSRCERAPEACAAGSRLGTGPGLTPPEQ